MRCTANSVLPYATAALVSFDTSVGDEAKQINGTIRAAKQTETSVFLNPLNRSIDDAVAEAHAEGRGNAATTLSSEWAEQFVQALPRSAPVPEVFVDADGHVAFEWTKDKRWVFEVTVDPNGILCHASLFGEETNHGKALLSSGIPESVRILLQRFARRE